MSNLFSELPYYLAWWVVDILWGAFGIYAFILLDGKARILLLVSSLIICLLGSITFATLYQTLGFGSYKGEPYFNGFLDFVSPLYFIFFEVIYPFAYVFMIGSLAIIIHRAKSAHGRIRELETILATTHHKESTTRTRD